MKLIKDLDETLYWDLVFLTDRSNLLKQLNIHLCFKIRNRLQQYYL